jgi:hypothetical protein
MLVYTFLFRYPINEIGMFNMKQFNYSQWAEKDTYIMKLKK